jgi:hypothetical protein
MVDTTRVARLRRELFAPTDEAEARLLLLINAFSDKEYGLEGRLKLAKLDFLLRYPAHLARAISARLGPDAPELHAVDARPTVESRMIRYKFGPWDPAYFTLIGRLVGKGLIEPVPHEQGIGFRSSSQGNSLASRIANSPEWEAQVKALQILRKHFDKTGTLLKKFLYETFPEIQATEMGASL